MEEKSILTLTDREHLLVTGVNKIVSFDEKHFELDTALGDLRIIGKGLIMEKLDVENQTLSISGLITNIDYEAIRNKKENFFNKLFK